MLDEQLRGKWRALGRATPIQPAMTFTAEGLVLGADTVLLPAASPRRLQSLQGQEVHLLALLSAFHGRPTAPSALRNIERAAKAWSEGDDCLAYIHLAHAGLSRPQDLQPGAYRLQMAQCAVKHGALPRAVFEALHFDARYIDAVEKAYSPMEPRVPAGSGRTSGEWTDGESAGEGDVAREQTVGEGITGPSLLARMPLPAPSFLGELNAAQSAELGAYALRLLGPVGAAAAAFGLLFFPSFNDVRVEGEVPEIPGLRYSWNRDETVLHLTYDRVGGAQSTFALQVDGDLIRGDDGKVAGRVIGGNRIAIDTLAVLPDLVKEDELRLCPGPAPDVAGSDQGEPYEENRSRQYEDFVKLLSEFIADDFIDQGTRQLAASRGRPIVWIFAEEEAALFARKLFDDKGLELIAVTHVSWIRSGRR